MHKPLIFRASSLGDIMADPPSIDESLLDDELLKIKRKKTKTDEEKALLEPYLHASLSAGAKTRVIQEAKELIYGYDTKVSNKYMEKGILVEDKSIELLNSVLFNDYKKNTERKTNEWVTGECDIYDPECIIDVKSSWSLDTFPVIASQGRDTTYEWQGRAYMMLYDVPKFKIAYALVNTPDHLVGYEDPKLHCVEHIAPELRLTFVAYERDMALENKIKVKVEAARKFYQSIIEQISSEHRF